MDQVEEIKNKVDIVQLAGEYVKLVRAGRNFKALCPFHGEKTPSFMVNPELQIFKCFGCGAGGDVYAFLQKIEGMEFGEALQALAKRVGITLVSYTPTRGEEERERLFNINNLTAEFYHYLLTQHRVGGEARRYLQERKISDKAIKTFHLGFAPAGWDYLIKYLAGRKRFNLEDLGKAGLVVESKYDRFRNRIMFPLNNHRGQTVGFAGRVLPGEDEKSGKYINTPETDIYHKGDLLYGLDVNRADIKKAGWAVVVEGEIDAIASWQAGVQNVVAVKGSALTAKQVDLLRRLGDRVVLGMDADLAGGSAARRGIGIAEKAGLFVETVDWSLAGDLPDGGQAKDVADVVSGDPKKWQQMAAGVISIYSFYIDSAIAKFGLSAEGKTRIARDVLGFLNEIGDEIRKDEYLKELSAKAGIQLEVLREQMTKVTASDEISTKEKAVVSVKTRREVLEEYIVGLALRNDKIDQLVNPQVKKLFETGFWKQVLGEIKSKSEERGEKAKVKSLIRSLPAELRERVQEQMLVEPSSTEASGDEERVEREWKKAVVELEEIGIREKIDKLKSGDKNEKQNEELLKLTRKLNELTREK